MSGCVMLLIDAVNLAAGKNSTDIALAVDAVDLACAERPAVMVIVSSDADFSPLVLKLREKGCSVLGIGQQHKTGDDTPAAYDGFIDLSHRTGAARKVATQTKPAKPAAAPAPPARRATAPPAGATAARARKAPALAVAAADEVDRVLDALPQLRAGEPVALNIAAERLRAAGLLAKNGSSTRLFGKYTAHFELAPAKQPNRVRWRGTAPA
jgi:hypothetical protein